MRIAWFHSHLLNANSGGTRFVLDYSEGLHRYHGHEVTLFCDIASAETRGQMAERGLKLVELDTVSTNSPRYWLTLPLRLKNKRAVLAQTISEYDFIINSMFPMNWLTADLALPKLQMCYEPFAFFYDLGFLQNFKLHQRLFFRMMKLLYAGQDRIATRKMPRVLTINQTNIPKLREEYGLDATAVYAGIDTDLYHRADAAAIAEIRAKHSGQPLLFHSTDLTGIKGSYPLLEVIAALRNDYPHIKLLFTVYVNDPVGTEKFLYRIKELNLSGNVEFLGCLPRRQLPLYYSAVDFVCQPSVNQPANWPLKEAMLCGTPIIAGAESEEAEDFVNGVKVDIRSGAAAAIKIKALFNRRGELSLTASIDNLLANYSRESCIAQLNNIIGEVYRENCKN